MFSGNSDPGAPGGGSNQQGGLFSGFFGGGGSSGGGGYGAPVAGLHDMGLGSAPGTMVSSGGGGYGPAPIGGLHDMGLGSAPGTMGPSGGGGYGPAPTGNLHDMGLGSAPGMLGTPAPVRGDNVPLPPSRPHFASDAPTGNAPDPSTPDANPYGGLPPGAWRGDPGLATTLLGGTPIGTIPSPAPPNPFGGLDQWSPGIARTFLGGTPTGVMPSAPPSNVLNWSAVPPSSARSNSFPNPGSPSINNVNNIGYDTASFFSPGSTNSGVIGQYGTPNPNDLPGSFLSKGMLDGGPPLQSNFVDPNIGAQNYSYNNVGPQSPTSTTAQGPFDLSAPW